MTPLRRPTPENQNLHLRTAHRKPIALSTLRSSHLRRIDAYSYTATRAREDDPPPAAHLSPNTPKNDTTAPTCRRGRRNGNAARPCGGEAERRQKAARVAAVTPETQAHPPGPSRTPRARQPARVCSASLSCATRSQCPPVQRGSRAPASHQTHEDARTAPSRGALRPTHWRLGRMATRAVCGALARCGHAHRLKGDAQTGPFAGR